MVGGEPAVTRYTLKGGMREPGLDGSIFIGSKSGGQYIVYGGLNAPNFEGRRRDLGFELFPRAGSIIASNAVIRIFARRGAGNWLATGSSGAGQHGVLCTGQKSQLGSAGAGQGSCFSADGDRRNFL